MRGRGVGSVAAAGVAALAVASTVFGRSEGVDPRWLLLAMVAVFAVAPTRRLVAALPLDDHRSPRLRRSPGPPAPPAVPSGLTAWVGRVNGGTTSARAATIRLVPALRELARLRLADRRGISLDHDPQHAAAALGAPTMAVVGPGAPRPMDSDRPGLPLDVLEELTTTLERL